MSKLDDERFVDGHQARQAIARMIDESAATKMADLFKALADPSRVRIICALAYTELCVQDLVAVLGMTQSAVSHQLRSLREMRLVRYRKEGRHVYYQLDDEHIHDLFRRGLEHVEHG